MTEKEILHTIQETSYPVIYLFTCIYFVVLYFGLGFIFNTACQFLAKRGILNPVIPIPANAISKIRFEIWHSCKSILIFGFSGVIMLYCYKHEIIAFRHSTVSNTLLGLLILMLWNEIHFYFFHRIFHLPYFYRTIHKIHHQSKIPTVYSVYSFHAVEAFVLSSVPLFVTPFLDFPLFAVLLFPLSSILFNFAGHCNYRFGKGQGINLTLFGTKHAQHHYKNKGNLGFITDFLGHLFEKKKSI